MKLQNAVTYVAEWAKLNPKKAVSILAFVLIALFLDGRAWAQELKWNEDQVSWTPPQQCADGSPISDCPISGYRIETASSAASTSWTTVTSVGASITGHKVTGLSVGQHCYRVIALSGGKESAPSNVACDTAEGPAPGSPTLQTIDTVAYEVKFKGFRFVLGKPVGTVPLGTACHKTFEIDGYYQIDREAVAFTRNTKSAVIVAKCA